MQQLSNITNWLVLLTPMYLSIVTVTLKSFVLEGHAFNCSVYHKEEKRYKYTYPDLKLDMSNLIYSLHNAYI